MKLTFLIFLAGWVCNIEAQWNISGSNIYNSNSGNVGIGTSSPSQPLDVWGTGYFQSPGINGLIRLKPPSASFNGTNRVIDFNENYDLANSAYGLVGIANTTWAAPLPSFAFLSAKSGTGTAKDIMFWADNNPSSSNVALTIKANTGNVGIGTINTQGYKLAVNGEAIFTKVKVKQFSSWPDYVFNDNYLIMSLKELDEYIQRNKHLPGVPSADQVDQNGLDLGDNQSVLLKKIEELTLYIIDQNKKIERLDKEVTELKKKENK